MIVNVRGANGCGKSALVRRFLDEHTAVPLYGVLGPKRPEAYLVTHASGPKYFGPLFVLGPYQATTGGTDALCARGLETIVNLLDKYSTRGHVLFEGVIYSITFGIIGEWLNNHKDKSIVAFLEVPLETCVASIKSRTGADASYKRVEFKINTLALVKKRMIGLGMRVETITRENGFERVKGWLTS